MSFLKSLNPEYKFHEELKNKHLNDYNHCEESKKSFNRKSSIFSNLLLIVVLTMIGICFYFKLKIELSIVLIVIPIFLILIIKYYQANLAKASCYSCKSEMDSQDDPIYGPGQKVYTCKSCKIFFCICYIKKAHAN